MVDRPRSVTRVVQLHWALVGLAVLCTALVVIAHDQMVESWTMGNANARELFEAGGAELVERELAVPAFSAVAIVFCLLLVGLVWVLLAFFVAGALWAQLSLTALLAGLAFGSVAGTLTGPPWFIVVIAYVSLAVELLAIVFLWHADTRAYVAGRDWRGPQPPVG